MQENPGGDGAPRDAGSGDARELFRIGKATEAVDLLCGSGESQITLRPDVGRAKSHKEIDVSGPWTHAWKPQQDGTDCIIAQLANGGEVERAGKEGSGESVTVGCFLSGEAGPPEAGLRGGRDMTRGNPTRPGPDPALGRHGRP